jgi:hypothetical protein
VANAGPNQTVFVTQTVQLNGSSSTDVDGDPLTYSWSFLSRPAGSTSALSDPAVVNPTFVVDKAGNYVVQLIVNDGFVNSAPSTVTISTTNSPPVAQCQNVSVIAGSLCTASASIDNGSYDPDGDPITPTQTPPGPYQLGDTLVTLTVTDSKGASSQCTGTVTVIDNTPPTISSASVTPSTLWPPNHQMVPVTLIVTATDNCGGVPVCRITSVSSNEPINGLGDGDMAPDWQIRGNLTVDLRSERSGTGNGRIYTINLNCVDAAGNLSSQRSVAVSVPKSQKK